MNTHVTQIKRSINSIFANILAVVGITSFMMMPVLGTQIVLSPVPAYAQQAAESESDTGGRGGKCGGADENNQVNTIIDIGCRERGNPIVDMLFAFIRILSIGVGIVVIGSLIVGGIQYIVSAGDPAAVAKAIERIRSTVIALLLYIFAYALLNWLIPNGILQ